MMREAQPLNVVNIEGILEELIPYRFAGNPKATRWIYTSIKRAITDENDWKNACAYLGITHAQCLTAREAQLLNMLSDALPLTSLPRASYIGRVLTQQDYLMYPWLADAVIRGDTLILMNISENAKNIIDHLCEVVVERFQSVEDPAVLHLSQVRAESDRWQRQLERQAEKAEGHVAQLGTLPDGKEVWLLLDKQAFAREGKVMHHCVGSYDPRPGRAILSVRDSESSIATIELQVHREQSNCSVEYPLIEGDSVDVVQMRGLKNEAVPESLHDDVVTFLKTMCTVGRTSSDMLLVFNEAIRGILGLHIGGDQIRLNDQAGTVVQLAGGVLSRRSVFPGDIVRISDLMHNEGSPLANHSFVRNPVSVHAPQPYSVDRNWELEIPLICHENRMQAGDPVAGNGLPTPDEKKTSGS